MLVLMFKLAFGVALALVVVLEMVLAIVCTLYALQTRGDLGLGLGD